MNQENIQVPGSAQRVARRNPGRAQCSFRPEAQAPREGVRGSVGVGGPRAPLSQPGSNGEGSAAPGSRHRAGADRVPGTAPGPPAAASPRSAGRNLQSFRNPACRPRGRPGPGLLQPTRPSCRGRPLPTLLKGPPCPKCGTQEVRLATPQNITGSPNPPPATRRASPSLRRARTEPGSAGDAPSPESFLSLTLPDNDHRSTRGCRQLRSHGSPSRHTAERCGAPIWGAFFLNSPPPPSPGMRHSQF